MGLNVQQLFFRREGGFCVARSNKLKVGNNIPVNILNGVFPTEEQILSALAVCKFMHIEMIEYTVNNGYK